ncbi:MAG: sulfatase [bacterium]|nr:sulfatase [bacterium]
MAQRPDCALRPSSIAINRSEAAGRARRRAGRRSSLRPAAALWLVTVTWSALLCGCRSAPEPSPSPLAATRGTILISIDTLRADHLGCYGYSRATSPFIDSLAARGALFENAIVQLPGTLPSHMSIFTGLYPAEHGVYPPSGVLAPDIPTLPELFRQQGWRTAGHTEGGYVHGGYGFARGFDEFSHEARFLESDAERTFARGVEFLGRLGAEERFFLFLHTYAVHDPYAPLERYADRYWDGPAPETFRATGSNLTAFNRGKAELTPEGLEYFKALYDASINYVDDVVRDLFENLERLGLSDEVTVVLTSDHGEEFLEHGRLAHEQIYPECLRVPLIVVHPELRGPRRIRTLVESIDIAPTLCEIGGIPRPKMSGRSFVPLLMGREELESEAFAEAFIDPVRSVLRSDENGFHQFLVSSRMDAGKWASRSFTFQAFAGKLRLEARSFHVPRQLRVAIDGEESASYALLPKEWRAITLRVPKGPAVRQITLSADDCVSPLSVGFNQDPHCLSFLVRGRSLPIFELYDLDADPEARAERSCQSSDLVRPFLKRLRSYDLSPVSDTEVRELDPELEKQLRALGYLQ